MLINFFDVFVEDKLPVDSVALGFNATLKIGVPN